MPASTRSSTRTSSTRTSSIRTTSPRTRSARATATPVVQEPAPAPAPTRSSRRRGSRAARSAPPVVLGSLTQPGARGDDHCGACGSTRVTSLAMTLTDGTPVHFTSCHACEHRSWVAYGEALDRASVLDRTRKVR
jgi:hypothetical protein